MAVRAGYESATFDVFGVPIAWLPYFRHPDPSVKRASGFLTPSFRLSGEAGAEINIPYYFNLAPNMDATFNARLTTERGLVLGGEYLEASVLLLQLPPQLLHVPLLHHRPPPSCPATAILLRQGRATEGHR